MPGRIEICYYGPKDLLNDYRKNGMHRAAFVTDIFPPKYLEIAKKIGSDVVPLREKREIMKSPLYKKFLTIPAGAYQRQEWKGMYLVENKIINAKEVSQYQKFLDSLDDSEISEELGVGDGFGQKDWIAEEEQEAKILAESRM